ncbi:hypothetical protein [Rhodovulum sp. P5]|uniref:hypothetical protein n=1 Tax=Rhodovulum sp. P5 TaxID=1564506 RepID=UPI00155F7BDD|nr:hypothetical protein [Rhodovulum sp. P5]
MPAPRAHRARPERAFLGDQVEDAFHGCGPSKCAGLAELAEAIRAGRPHFPSAEFTLHLTELTLAIQAAGPDGASHTPVHRFDPAPMPDRTRAGRDYRPLARPAFLPRLVQGITGKGA